MKFQVINIKTGKPITSGMGWHEADSYCKRLNEREIRYKIVEVKSEK